MARSVVEVGVREGIRRLFAELHKVTCRGEDTTLEVTCRGEDNSLEVIYRRGHLRKRAPHNLCSFFGEVFSLAGISTVYFVVR